MQEVLAASRYSEHTIKESKNGKTIKEEDTAMIIGAISNGIELLKQQRRTNISQEYGKH